MNTDIERMTRDFDYFCESFKEAQDKAKRYEGYASKALVQAKELAELKLENLRLKGDFALAKTINDELIEENERLEKEIDRLRDKGGSLASYNESVEAKLKHTEKVWREESKALQTEIDRLRTELAEERNNHDRLQDFEVAEAEELREAKLYLRILLEYLGESGYDVEKLEKIVALKRCIMKLEETNE